MAADGAASKTSAFLADDAVKPSPVASTPLANPTKRPRPSDSASPSAENSEMMKLFQSMLESALAQHRTELTNEICESINSRFDEQASKIDAQAERISDLKQATESNSKILNNLRCEVDALRTDHHSKLQSIDKNIKSQAQSLSEVANKIEVLNQEVADLKQQRIINRREAIDTQARMRRNNLLFYGLEDDEKENAEQSELKIKKFIKEKLKVEPKSIQRAHRVGRMQAKPANGAKNRPRPIIVLFSDYKEKESIRAKRIELVKPFGIAEDLPLEIRQARKSLQGKLEAARRDNKKATIIYPCRLLIDGKIVETVDPAEFSLQ